MSAHQPLRPNWSCVGCGYPWPCPSRRRQLLAQYADAPVSLALVLGSAMIEAAADLRGTPAGDLHDRFVGWVPPLLRRIGTWRGSGRRACCNLCADESGESTRLARHSIRTFGWDRSGRTTARRHGPRPQ